MAARKNKGGKSRKKTQAPARKSRLWLRDMLNILGGLLVGSMGVWLFQEFQENRAARAVARKYVKAVRETMPHLKPMAEQYLALSQGREGESLPEVELDAARPVCSLDPFRGLLYEVCDLPPDAVPPLLEFVRNLQKAEILRKLLEQQQQNPAELSRILSSQILVTVYDESRDAPNLFWKLKESAGRGAAKEAEKELDKEAEKDEAPEPEPS